MNKPYHHGNLRVALLEAARERLAHKTELELSLRDLALSLGVTVNATYRHFESKEALLMELAAVGFDALRMDMQAATGASKQATPRDRMYLAGEAYAAFAQREPSLFSLMFGRRGRFDTQARFREASGAAFRVVVECVAAIRGEPANSSGCLRTSVAAWSLVHGYATLAVQGYFSSLPAGHQPDIRAIVRMIDLESPSPVPPVSRPARPSP